MRATITPGALSGSVSVPPSKSVAHRALICAAFADQPSNLTLASTNDDIRATVGCLRELGARFDEGEKGVMRVIPIPRNAQGELDPNSPVTLDCGESGTTLRFMLPIVSALGISASFTGRGRLSQRPLSPLYECLAQGGVQLSAQGTFPLEVRGRLRKRVFTIEGNVSSQYVSGLLLAGPLLGVATVHVLKPIESRPYIGLTIDALESFGVRVTETVGVDRITYRVASGSSLHGLKESSVEGDWSAASFWLGSAALGNKGVAVNNLSLDSHQGDRAFLDALERLGCSVQDTDEGITAEGRHLIGCKLNVRQIPDLVPPLAAIGALAKGTTRISGASRLRLKESDRLESVAAALNALGARVTVSDDGLTIVGVPQLVGGTCDAANDHRIAMMAAMVASRCENPVVVVGAECVSKSYPAFFDDLTVLGGKVQLTSE